MADDDGKPLPPLPPSDYGEHQYGPPGMDSLMPVPVPMDHPDYEEYGDDGEYYHPDDYGSSQDYNRLSTITERTERSDYSKQYLSARQVAYRDSISSNTEYGAFRGAFCSPHDHVVCSRLYPKIRGSPLPLPHLHLLCLGILISSRRCPHQGNRTLWD